MRWPAARFEFIGIDTEADRTDEVGHMPMGTAIPRLTNPFLLLLLLLLLLLRTRYSYIMCWCLCIKRIPLCAALCVALCCVALCYARRPWLSMMLRSGRTVYYRSCRIPTVVASPSMI